MEINQDTRRQLAAILFADIAGYTALMHANEQKALEILQRFKTVLEQKVENYGGEVIQYYGDGCLMSFATAANAVQCGRDMQLLFKEELVVPVRMGIHMGDIVFKEGNAYGDSVNIASRVESMGVPGAVLYSATVEQQLRNQGISSLSLGSFAFKNLPTPLEVFALRDEGLPVPEKGKIEGKFAEKRSFSGALRIGAVGLLVVIGAGTWMITRAPGDTPGAVPDTEPRALAILPFANASDDVELAYLSDGIPGNLINRLSGLPDLRVLARNATFSMRDSVVDYTRVRDLFNADVLLTGQVSRINDYLVVDCELTDVKTKDHIWGHRISKKSSDLLALEDSLVRALFHPLKLHLKSTPDAVLAREDIAPEAYDHYMQGRHLTYGSTFEESDRAIEHFRKAIEIEPRYAEAYAAIANEKVVQAMFSTTSRKEITGEARTAVQSALALDPMQVEANLAKASLAFYLDYDWLGAGKAYEQAFDANPNDPTTLIRYSAYLAAVGDTDRAVPMAQKAVRIDPVTISSLHNLGWVSYLAQDYVSAKRAFGKALDLYPDWIWGHTKKGYSHVRLGECDTALVLAKRGVELLGDWGSEILQATFIYINERCDNREAADSLSKRFFMHIEEHGYEDPLSVFFVHYAQGNIETAIDWAERILDEESASAYLLIIDSFWLPELYHHPRYQALLGRLGWKGKEI